MFFEESKQISKQLYGLARRRPVDRGAAAAAVAAAAVCYILIYKYMIHNA